MQALRNDKIFYFTSAVITENIKIKTVASHYGKDTSSKEKNIWKGHIHISAIESGNMKISLSTHQAARIP